MTGKTLAHMAPADERCKVLSGDIDGDGKREAVLRVREAGIETYRAYGYAGKRTQTFELDAEDHCTMLGDLNGDGRDEFVNFELGTITSYTKKKRTEYEGWPTDILPGACYDVNGDKRDEVVGVSSRYAHALLFAPTTLPKAEPVDGVLQARVKDQERREWVKPKGGWLDVKSGKFTAFAFPDIDYRCNVFSGDSGEVAVGDIDRDGKREFILKPWLGTLVLVFATDGSLKYYEEFGEGAMDFGVLRSGGKDWLVVQTETRLLIYP